MTSHLGQTERLLCDAIFWPWLRWYDRVQTWNACHNVQQCRHYSISKTFYDKYRENCKFVDFNHPTPVRRQ